MCRQACGKADSPLDPPAGWSFIHAFRSRQIFAMRRWCMPMGSGVRRA